MNRLHFALFFVLLAAAPSAATEFHVAPDGNDANAGTSQSPFATLQRARDAVRAVREEGATPPEPVTVFLADGVYRLDHAVVFRPQDSGTPEAPVVYRAAPGARPVLSGGRPITSWRKHDERLWVAEVPWAASREEPLVQLFINGERRPRARTPDRGQYFYTKRLAQKESHGRPCFGMTVVEGDLKPWDAPDERVVCLFHNWVNSYNYVKEADWPRRRLTFARQAGAYFMGPTVRYYVENAFDYLDAPGEWYFDRAEGLLYYDALPGETMTRVEAIAPHTMKTLIRVAGDPSEGRYVEHLSFVGITLAHTEADLSRRYPHSVQGAHLQTGAFHAVGMRHCTIEDCEFTRLGEHAISMHEACAWNTVRRCHIHDMGGGGAYLSQGAPRRTEDEFLTAHNTIENNFIHDGGHFFRAGCGVFLGGSASYNRIVHNEICDLSWMGVHLGWSWTGLKPAFTHHNEVAFNHIHHLGGGVLNDIGGIYTIGVSPGTVLHHNLIHDVTRFTRGDEGYGGWGIYLDAGSSEILVENNVVYDTQDGGLHLHCDGYPHDDVVRNNIFAYSKGGQLMRNNNREPEGVHLRLERNIVYNAGREMFWGRNWEPDGKFLSDRNCFYSESGEPTFYGGTFDQWRASGRDQNSIIVDPRFVCAPDRDFRLEADSPAFALGFEAIDLSSVGLVGPEDWVALPRGVSHRERETAVAPMPVWPLRLDFEDYAPQGLPDGALPSDDAARVTITDQRAGAGRQSMRFEDGQSATSWKPHWFTRFERDTDAMRVRLMVRNDAEQPATIDLEGRDWPKRSTGPYATGPKLRLLKDGSISARTTTGRWETVGTYPLAAWVSIEITCPQGDSELGPWKLRVAGPEGQILVRDDLPLHKPAFEQLNWFGIVSAEESPAVFHVDEIEFE